MVKSYDVLQLLRPEGGWVVYGDDFDSIQWLECEPLTEAEFNAGFTRVDAWKMEQEAAKQAKRTALLDRLGITEDEAKLLLGYE